MRVAIFSDVHGNYVSLEVVLADIQRQHVDQVVCLGDVAATGPQPRECVRRIQDLGCPVVMGNADESLCMPDLTDGGQTVPAELEEIDRWCATQLGDDERAFIRTFVPTLTLELEADNRLLCFHGSPRSHSEIITAETPEADLLKMLSGHDSTVMAGGHTHVALYRRIQDRVLINPGSVGLPHDIDADGQVCNPPWAEYATVDCRGESLSILLRRVPVDIERIRSSIQTSGVPHADLFLQGLCS